MNQIGIYNLPRASDAGFYEVEKEAKETEKIPQSPAEPNLVELGQAALNSNRLGPVVEKPDAGFEVI